MSTTSPKSPNPSESDSDTTESTSGTLSAATGQAAHSVSQPDAAPTQTAPQPDPDPSADPEAGDAPGDEQVGALRKEAAGYRKRAREAEARADAADAKLAALLDHLVAQAAGDRGVKPEALQAAGVDRAAWFGEGGAFLPEALAADVRATAEMFAIPRKGHNPHTGTGAENPAEALSWADAIKG